MEKIKKYWLNEYGERYWYLKTDITKTAHRSYHWVDRISYLNEGSVTEYDDNGTIKLTTSDRLVISKPNFNHPDKYSDFKFEKKLWQPIKDYQEYTKMLKFYYECKKYNVL